MHTYIISNDEDDYIVTQHDIDNNFFPNTKRNRQETLVPIVVVLVSTINDVKLPRSLLSVFDSGSTGCLYNRNAILCGAKTITIKHPTVLSTTQGTYKSNKVVMLEDFQMMEFTNLRYI